MRRHASAIAGGRRKKDQKPIRHSNKDSIKVPKDSKRGDKDDFALNSKLKPGSDIEQKIDLKRRQVKQNTKGQTRSLSRSARKSSRDITDDR